MRLCGACVSPRNYASSAPPRYRLLLSAVNSPDSPKVAIFSFIELWQTWRLFEPGTHTIMV